jgi:hypothetical protein
MRKRELMQKVSAPLNVGESIHISRYQHGFIQPPKGIEVWPLRMFGDRVAGLWSNNRAGTSGRSLCAQHGAADPAVSNRGADASARAETNADTCSKADASARSSATARTGAHAAAPSARSRPAFCRAGAGADMELCSTEFHARWHYHV